jgi:hypothetical protein
MKEVIECADASGPWCWSGLKTSEIQTLNPDGIVAVLTAYRQGNTSENTRCVDALPIHRLYTRYQRYIGNLKFRPKSGVSDVLIA